MYWLLQTLLHITVTALRLLCANNPWNMLKACLGEHISIVLQAYVRLHDFGALHSSAGMSVLPHQNVELVTCELTMFLSWTTEGSCWLQ
ncbi:hypothetical protein M758_UG222300 [Ceratodon purpureus]|nr:hypothetical protein M758_UG222300 [Ceratodon purpureus]